MNQESFTKWILNEWIKTTTIANKFSIGSVLPINYIVYLTYTTMITLRNLPVEIISKNYL